MKRITFEVAHTQDDFFRLIRLRQVVFVEEQGIPVVLVIDDDDGEALHLIARRGREVVGTARLVSKGTSGKIGRMAVKREVRRQSIGTGLIAFIQKISVEMELAELVLHAQVPAVPFYERLGFSTVGKKFKEAGIPHRKMTLRLADPLKKSRSISGRRE
jgi:predicted GNAT family N-acyltransferase